MTCNGVGLVLATSRLGGELRPFKTRPLAWRRALQKSGSRLAHGLLGHFVHSSRKLQCCRLARIALNAARGDANRICAGRKWGPCNGF